MKSNVLLRLVLLVCLTVCLSLPSLAQSSAAGAPVLTFGIANNVTIHKSSGSVLIPVTAASAAGLANFTLSGANTLTRVLELSNATSAKIGLTFFVFYYPTGTYPFVATATGLDGKTTQQSIIVTVVP